MKIKRIMRGVFVLITIVASPILFEALEWNRLEGLCAKIGIGAPIEQNLAYVNNAAFVEVIQFDRIWSNENGLENMWVTVESLLANRKISCEIEHDGKNVISHGASSTFWEWLH